jgi:hypothetical protein
VAATYRGRRADRAGCPSRRRAREVYNEKDVQTQRARGALTFARRDARPTPRGSIILGVAFLRERGWGGARRSRGRAIPSREELPHSLFHRGPTRGGARRRGACVCVCVRCGCACARGVRACALCVRAATGARASAERGARRRRALFRKKNATFRKKKKTTRQRQPARALKYSSANAPKRDGGTLSLTTWQSHIFTLAAHW